MRTQPCKRVRPIAPIALAALLGFLPSGLAHASETITATAHVKTAGGVEASAPVRIEIDRFSTDGERDALVAALQRRGTEGVRSVLATRDPIGSVHVGSVATPIKFASVRTTAGGRLITAVTGSPIAFMGAGVPGAKPTAGFDLGLVIVEVAASGSGRGELVPAAKIRADEQGAIATDDYSGEVVQLSNVAGK